MRGAESEGHWTMKGKKHNEGRQEKRLRPDYKEQNHGGLSKAPVAGGSPREWDDFREKHRRGGKGGSVLSKEELRDRHLTSRKKNAGDEES